MKLLLDFILHQTIVLSNFICPFVILWIEISSLSHRVMKCLLIGPRGEMVFLNCDAFCVTLYMRCCQISLCTLGCLTLSVMGSDTEHDCRFTSPPAAHLVCFAVYLLSCR